MLEFFTLILFCLFLLFCLIFDFSILYALIAGLILFLLYGKRKGFSWNDLFLMTLTGIKTVKNILITFLLIGMLTALWRSSGTIAVIVCYTTRLIQPSIFLLMAFLLNCLISFLTGTAFGTAATMGVICATIASTLQINPILIGGVILSGVFFGDRCSPVSTSALLVAELTQTSIFHNIKRMLYSACIPFFLTCGIYFVVGLLSEHSGDIPDLQVLFGKEFELSWVALLPAIIILILSLLQINVKTAMLASIFVSIPICFFIQHIPISELPEILLTGYSAVDPEVSEMLNGGGITSMLKVGAIVCLSSSYSGIFQKTGLLKNAKHAIAIYSKKTNSYTAILLTSIITCMIACNQTLTIMLAHQLCSQTAKDNSTLANDLEDSAVIISPLIPWSIAGAVPLATVGAPTESLLFACFLYLLPLWRIVKTKN